ncbi:hypothetical protein [Mycolicibacterium obuense]|uniref:Uncharacterized protein n=1 Tax=Mycolicibacterium obuense TaxID=1807 RepID=A0A0J6VHM1_9MYCO|nr:hypothetical protein [Mycolicibacterium obuense]KMO69774.1 hypothetical protein MOBUDSM44075_04245 [Mycolicibacterium obuense]
MTEPANKSAPEATPLRRDGNARYYNQINPPATHFIEQTVAVHLRLSDDGARWIVDGPSVDGHPLDSTYRDLSATNAECACSQPKECTRLRDDADNLPLPTGAELLAMLGAALDAPAQLITAGQASSWAGRPLTADELDRLCEAIPHSSIPEAIGTIVASWD